MHYKIATIKYNYKIPTCRLTETMLKALNKMFKLCAVHNIR
jgi:hypothetical protein